MKKTFAAVALAGILTFSVGTIAAQAAPNTSAEGSVTVSEAAEAPGKTFTYAGTGFTPEEVIDTTVTHTGPAAAGAFGSTGGGLSLSAPSIGKPAAPISFTTTVAADGTFSVPVILAKTGSYTLATTGRTSGKTAAQAVKVTASADAATTARSGGEVAGVFKGGVANTGIDLSVLVWSLVGSGALATGMGTVVTSRRRHRNTQDA